VRGPRFSGTLAFAVVAILANHCGSAPANEATATLRQPIIGGSLVDAANSPVLSLRGPQGACTAVLVAPNLVATARHCAAVLTEGDPSCDPSGGLSPGTTAGELGADDTPSQLAFYTEASVAAGNLSGTPDAVGAQIVSTQAQSVCSDDLSFVVLNRSIPGIAPAAIRITGATQVGEAISVLGYGLTENAGDPVALRLRADAQVTAIGPDTPPATTQPAPVRSIRVGPGATTCSGDSGGPFLSNATGAMIGLVSLGRTSGEFTTSCTLSATADTTGPRLAEYQDVILIAFSAAGASPIPETPTVDGDAGPPTSPTSDGGASIADSASPMDDTEAASPTPDVDADPPSGAPRLSGGCAIADGRPARTPFAAGWIALALAGFVTTAARRRRR
jgi:hypothetical protein